jgi:hypothetical protein
MEPQLAPRAAHSVRRPPSGPGAASCAPLAARALLAAACALLAACSLSTQKPISHLAVVVRIEQPEGVFYSPRLQGAGRALTKVYLRPSGGESSGGRLLVVSFLGPYGPARLGQPGDVVTFTYSGPISAGMEIPFEDLAEYAVIARPPAREGPRITPAPKPP